MTAVIRAGLPAGTGKSSYEWRTHFDSASNELDLLREGWFWQAVATTNEDECRLGLGQVIAIIDSGFDEEILNHMRHLIRTSSDFPIASKRVDLFDGHGTLVALLVHAVAPSAELLLVDVGSYDGYYYAEHVAAGIKSAVASGATVLNLSVEFSSEAQPGHMPGVAGVDLCNELDRWFAAVEPYADDRCPNYCPVCTALDSVPDSISVIAATGQSYFATCPAVSRAVIGASFQHSTLDYAVGHLVVKHMPSETDSILVRGEVDINEIPGFVGTSFASPLLAGFAALVGDPVAFATASRFPKGLTPLLQLHCDALNTVRNQDELSSLSPAEAAALYGAYHPNIRSGVEHAKALVPAGHNHWDPTVSASPCGLCELFAQDLYIVEVTDLIEAGRFDEGLVAAERAAQVCPRSPRVQNNLRVARERLQNP